MKLACESMDRIATTEIRLPSLHGRGIIVREYEAARKGGDPLSYQIAQAILESLRQGKNRFGIFTGFWNETRYPNGETDGPPGAVVLGRAIEMLGGDVTYCLEKETIPGTLHLLRYLEAGQKVVALDRENADNNTKLADQFDAAVFTEKCGPAKGGVYHYCTGPDRTGEDADVAGFVNRFNAQGKLSIGFGDYGNEVGCGRIYNEAREILKQAGADEEIVTCLATTYYFPCTVSNIGCYTVTAALSALTSNQEILHTPEKERELIRIGTEENMIDGGYALAHDYIDGIPASTMCAIVETLRCLSVICHDNRSRGF